MDLDEALDHVFSQPLATFTEERNRIAKELAAAGDKEGAASIKAIKKPSVSAWAVNQLARRSRDGMDELVGLHEELAGTRGGVDLRRITDERRRLIARLTEEAASLLDQAGHTASSATTGRIAQTLLAASSGGELEALAEGRLTADLEAPGFDAMSGFDTAADSAPFERADNRARDRAEELARKAAEAEAEAAELRNAAERAEAEAGRLATQAEKAARRAESARAKADAALEELG
jgi:hypothetical protein